MQDCVDAINSTPNATTKYTPNLLWRPENYYGYVPPARVGRVLPRTLNPDAPPTNQVIATEVAQRLRDRAKRLVALNKTKEFKVNDQVRVKMSRMYSYIRGIIKGGNKKWLTIMYTPEIYKIVKIMKPDHVGLEKSRYLLETLDGTPLVTEYMNQHRTRGHNSMHLFATDMIHASDTTPTSWTNEQAYNIDVKHEPQVGQHPVRLLRTDILQTRGLPWLYVGDRIEPAPRVAGVMPRAPRAVAPVVEPVLRPQRRNAGVNSIYNDDYDIRR